MKYEAIDNTKFKTVETKQEEIIYDINDLENDRAIYVANIAKFQKKIDDIDALILQATSIGVVGDRKLQDKNPIE